MTYVRFWSTQLKLDDTDFCLLYPRWPSRSGDNVLVQYNTVYKFRVLNRATNLLHNPNIT